MTFTRHIEHSIDKALQARGLQNPDLLAEIMQAIQDGRRASLVTKVTQRTRNRSKVKRSAELLRLWRRTHGESPSERELAQVSGYDRAWINGSWLSIEDEVSRQLGSNVGVL